MEKIMIHTIVTEGLQTRVALNEEVVAEYGEILRGGGTLPPVIVFRDDLTDRLADGFHRLEAARRLGRIDIEAEVHDGDKTAALRYALKANAAHGLRRTNEDKRNALQIAWDNRRSLFGHDPSKRELAAACAVSDYLAWDFIKETKVVENTTRADSSSDEGRSAAVGGAVLDRYGTPVPENLAGAFDARKTKKMSRLLRKIAADVEKAQKGGDYAFSRISQATLVTLRNAASDLKLETPWCVCRQCQGVGCRACGETGVQTKREYDLNPSELKV